MFDRICLINLDKRKDRLGAFKAKIAPYPMLHDYVRYRAVHGDSVTVPQFFVSGGGAWGCRQSHLRVLEDALMDKVDTLLVLEDDVRFCPNFEIKLREFLKIVPDDWEGLMLGGQDQPPGSSEIGVSGVLRSMNTQRTHAYVVRGAEPMRDLYRLWARCDRHIDHWFGQWQQRHQVYRPDNFFCGQDEGSSDISGKLDTIRYWSDPGNISTKDCPLLVLISDRAVAERIRNFGFHFGYDRDAMTGRDNGLIALEAQGWPIEKAASWATTIITEAVERGDTPGMWHVPTPDARFLETHFRRTVKAVEARSVEDAVVQIPALLPAWKASRILWCWRGEGQEILEGMRFHGWHRGYWIDEITGLDQGIRQAVEHNKYNIFKQLHRQLEREIETIRYGKLLFAHPRLSIDRLRDELPGAEIHEIVGENIHELIEHSQKIIEAGIEMYRTKDS